MKIIAHRGYSELYPENTLLAFTKAIEAGVNGIETDIRLSSDGHAVISHDSSLMRITNKDEYVEDVSLEYLRSLDAGSWFDSKYRDLKIPTLEELLEIVQGKVKLILEIKYHEKTYKKVSEIVLEAISDKLSWIEVSSFSDEIIGYVHRLNSDIKVHKLIEDVEVLEKEEFDSFYRFASFFDIDVTLQEHEKCKELITKGNVVFWTVGDEDIASSKKLGLYGAMCNDPVALKKRYA